MIKLIAFKILIFNFFIMVSCSAQPEFYEKSLYMDNTQLITLVGYFVMKNSDVSTKFPNINLPSNQVKTLRAYTGQHLIKAGENEEVFYLEFFVKNGEELDSYFFKFTSHVGPDIVKGKTKEFFNNRNISQYFILKRSSHDEKGKVLASKVRNNNP